MKQLGIILPDDLAINNIALTFLDKSDVLLMFEPCDTFYHINHHKQKIAFLISSLRHWKEELQKKYTNIIHIKICKNHDTTFMGELQKLYEDISFDVIHITEPSDHNTLTQLMFFGSKNKVEIKIHQDTKFIDSIENFSEWTKDKKSLVQEYYYRWLRKKYGILMKDGKPLGGKWNYDKDNQQSISKLKQDLPIRVKSMQDPLTIEAMVDVENCFPQSLGALEEFNWAVTHDAAREQLKNFLTQRLHLFGEFQDAIHKDDSRLFHSLLSPYLNSGLLDPMECIVDAVSEFHSSKGLVPINSLEGFIRQILGWREFIRGVYWQNMPEYKDANFWGHKKSLTQSWYEGTTGIPPVDDAIKDSLKYGYTHHINRLMIISNVMNLAGIRPNEIYKWFMEMYVDSADWVMVPNVYGMGTYADGGIFATKPYICGSSYMLRMSNYKKGEWCDVVDGLYWRFIEKNREFFTGNPRLALMPKSLDKIDQVRKKRIFLKAEEFISNHTF